MSFIDNLQCPITKSNVTQINRSDFEKYNIPSEIQGLGEISNGLTDESESYFYPVFNDIIILHEYYALYIGTDKDVRAKLNFDKKRVFDYYNEVSYKIKDSLKIYEDSPKWVDFREVSSAYIKTCFGRAANHLPPSGKYLLDIASGPIGLPEYLALSDGFDYRICADISVNALIQAKTNLDRAGKKGIFICGDITNIPIKDYVCDAVLCQHTLYHIPKNEQKTAVNEMSRVTANNGKVVIIYSWFYHSWFMNLSLNIIQLYRIVRHFAGKLYVKTFKSKPRLYFYPHSPGWFKKSFSFSKNIEFYCWRSTNKYFLDIFIHKKLFGKKILEKLMNIEKKHSRFMSTFGDYPAIVITKTKT